MYESHFGFSGSPFQLNPDPAFYFGSRGHTNALAYLKFGAHQGEGFIVVTGEIGAGKTTLVRTLLEGLNPEQVVAAHVVNTQLESTELLQSILLAFGVASNRTSKAYLIATLEGFLTTLAAKGRRALLIIDEAQNLRHEAVEELRMLSNFQLGKHGLLQSFLVGQPELRGLLQSKTMEQLRQRVIASCHLGPLDAQETRAYIEHRLSVVGWKGTSPQLGPDVHERVHHWTGGVPRKINRLCNRLLLGAFLANARVVTISMVDETAGALKDEIGEATSAPASPGLDLGPPHAPPAPVAVAPAGAPTAAQTPPPVPRSEPAASSALTLVAGSSTAPAPLAQSPVVFEAHTDRSPPTLLRNRSPTPPVFRSASAPLDLRGALAARSEAATAPTINSSPLSSHVVRRVHHSVKLLRPLVCLVDSASDYLKAGLLADVFRGFPSLPQIVAVHAGVESDLDISDLNDIHMPLPALGVHLGVSAVAYATQASRLVEAFDALLTEIDPCAIMVFGSSNADLACSLLASKRGLRLLHTVSGMRGQLPAHERALNVALIERIADVLYTDSTASFYALYREGIHLDRVQSVGSLTREVLDVALGNSDVSLAFAKALLDTRTSHLSEAYGLITVDPRVGFDEVGSLSTTIELLCELSRELPLVWLVHADCRRLVEKSDGARRIEASNLTLVEPAGVRQSLAMLRAAKCLIARDEGAWLADAQYLAVATLVLTSSSSLESTASDYGVISLETLGASGRTKFRQLLEFGAVPTETPDYWDGGTASRIAGHLVGWLSKTALAPSAGVKAAHELVSTRSAGKHRAVRA